MFSMTNLVKGTTSFDCLAEDAKLRSMMVVRDKELSPNSAGYGLLSVNMSTAAVDYGSYGYCGAVIIRNDGSNDVFSTDGDIAGGGDIVITRDWAGIFYRTGATSFGHVKAADAEINFSVANMLPDQVIMTPAARAVGSPCSSWAFTGTYLWESFKQTRLSAYPDFEYALLAGLSLVEAYGIKTGTFGLDFLPTTAKGALARLLNPSRATREVWDFKTDPRANVNGEHIPIGFRVINRSVADEAVRALQEGFALNAESWCRLWGAPPSLARKNNGVLSLTPNIEHYEADKALDENFNPYLVFDSSTEKGGIGTRITSFLAGEIEAADYYVNDLSLLAAVNEQHKEKYIQFLREKLEGARSLTQSAIDEAVSAFNTAFAAATSIEGAYSGDLGDYATVNAVLTYKAERVTVGPFNTAADGAAEQIKACSAYGGYISPVENDEKCSLQVTDDAKAAIAAEMRSAVQSMRKSIVQDVRNLFTVSSVAGCPASVKNVSQMNHHFHGNHNCTSDCSLYRPAWWKSGDDFAMDTQASIYHYLTTNTKIAVDADDKVINLRTNEENLPHSAALLELNLSPMPDGTYSGIAKVGACYTGRVSGLTSTGMNRSMERAIAKAILANKNDATFRIIKPSNVVQISAVRDLTYEEYAQVMAGMASTKKAKVRAADRMRWSGRASHKFWSCSKDSRRTIEADYWPSKSDCECRLMHGTMLVVTLEKVELDVPKPAGWQQKTLGYQQTISRNFQLLTAAAGREAMKWYVGELLRLGLFDKNLEVFGSTGTGDYVTFASLAAVTDFNLANAQAMVDELEEALSMPVFTGDEKTVTGDGTHAIKDSVQRANIAKLIDKIKALIKSTSEEKIWGADGSLQGADLGYEPRLLPYYCAI